MSLSDDLHFPGRIERLQPVLTDRLQHHKVWLLALLLGLLQEAFVNQRGHAIQH